MRRVAAHDRAFVVSLGVSVLFHLSMVTVFSIVIVFPRETVRYHSFRIVEPAAQRPVTARAGNHLSGRPRPDARLRVPSVAEATADGASGLIDEEALWASLPQIKLPTVEFAELRRLRVHERGLAVALRRESLLDTKPRDTWAWFGDELGQIGSALSRLRSSDEKAPREEPWAARTPTTRPAAGFEAYVKWMDEPRDRQLLVAPPIAALRDVDPATLDRPIVFEFTVNAEGRVTSAWSPRVDEHGIITDAQKTVLKYRFEPIDGTETQQATLHITAMRRRP